MTVVGKIGVLSANCLANLRTWSTGVRGWLSALVVAGSTNRRHAAEDCSANGTTRRKMWHVHECTRKFSRWQVAQRVGCRYYRAEYR